MRKVRLIIHPLAISLILIYTQLNYFPPDFSRGIAYFNYPIVISAMLLGIIFGLLGCPACSLPLSLSLVLWQDKLKKTILPIALFNISRLVGIFSYAIIGNLGLGILRSFIPIRYMFILNGIIMIAFGIIIFKRLYVKVPLGNLNKIKAKNITFLYVIWGVILGFPCGFEATGFLVYLWSYPTQIFLKILSLFIFSLSAITPIVIFTVMFLLGMRGISLLFVGFKDYLKNLASFYLVSIGLIFILVQLK